MIAVRSNTMYPVSSAPVENGTVLIGDDGKILCVGKDVPIPAGAEVYEADTVMPGIIDAHTHLAMCDFQHAVELNDTTEPVAPQRSIIDGLDTAALPFRLTRAAGFTSCCVLPGSLNLIGGQGAVIKLDGRQNPRDSVFGPVQMKMALGENPRRFYGARGRSPMTRMGNAAMLREAMRSFYAYYTRKGTESALPFDAGAEAMCGVFDGTTVVHVHAHRADDILTAIRILEPYGIRFSIDHCTEGYKIGEILAAKDIPCIAGELIMGPTKQEVWQTTPKNPRYLEQAGVQTIALTTDGDTFTCRLPLEAGVAMRYGFSEEMAFKSVTLSAARILGVDDRVGSLEPGKDADIALFNGFPFENDTRCEGVFIDGRFFPSDEPY